MNACQAITFINEEVNNIYKNLMYTGNEERERTSKSKLIKANILHTPSVPN